MSHEETSNPGECSVCGSNDGTTFVVVTKEPLEDEAYIPHDPIVVCSTHYGQLSESDEYHVRELAPVPDARGGFNRTDGEKTASGEIRNVVYDTDISNESWIKFDPRSDEIDLTEVKRKQD